MAAKKRLGRMIGGAASAAGSAASAVCPPGVWCMDTGILVLIGLLVIAIVAAIVYGIPKMQASAKPQPPTVVVVERPASATAPALTAPVDPRFGPLSPEQSYMTPPDIRGFPTAPLPAGMGAIPVNQMTRGYPDQYQQIGVLTAPGGSETSASPSRTILPLFGRKLVTNRDRWNYYTRTDGINPVQVPVQYKRRSCDDDLGCDEIMTGENVSVPILGQSYVANVYRYSTPRYLPF